MFEKVIDPKGITAAFTALAGSYEVTTGLEFLATGDIKRELGITLEDNHYQARLEAGGLLRQKKGSHRPDDDGGPTRFPEVVRRIR